MATSKEARCFKLDIDLDNASSTPHQAAHRVFSTTELLCNIVAHLPLRDLFTARAVCREWRRALVGDPTTQKALFLKPTEVREVLVEYLLIQNLEGPIPISECTIIGELNPWISDICGSVRTSDSYPKSGKSQHMSVNLEFLFSDGLWREMFVTQPPCNSITVVFDSDSGWRLVHGEDSLTMNCEHGIKMGELYDFIEEEIHYRADGGGTVIHIKNFDTDDYTHHTQFPTARCKVRNGEVCRPAELPERCSDLGSEYSADYESGYYEDDDEPHGILSYEDYDFEDDDEYSNDDQDLDEFDAEQADEADQYFRW